MWLTHKIIVGSFVFYEIKIKRYIGVQAQTVQLILFNLLPSLTSFVFAVHSPLETFSFLVPVLMRASRDLDGWNFPFSLNLHGDTCPLVLLANLEFGMDLFVAQFASSFSKIGWAFLHNVFEGLILKLISLDNFFLWQNYSACAIIATKKRNRLH